MAQRRGLMPLTVRSRGFRDKWRRVEKGLNNPFFGHKPGVLGGQKVRRAASWSERGPPEPKIWVTRRVG